MSVRVLVVDSHEIVRVGLREITHGTEFTVEAEASNLEQATELMESKGFDLILSDIQFECQNAFAKLAKILKSSPYVPLLIYSQHDHPAIWSQAIAIGASGLLRKNEQPAEVLAGMRKVHSGVALWSRDELRKSATHEPHPLESSDLQVFFNSREGEILKSLVSGDTNKQIAEKIGVSYETVKELIQQLFKKIGVTDRVQAAIWAARNGLA